MLGCHPYSQRISKIIVKALATHPQNEGERKESIVVQEFSAANSLLSTALLHEQQVAGLEHAACQCAHIPTQPSA